MLRKIECSSTGLCYDDTKLDLYVDYQDPTKFIFTDKSVIPLLTFTCDHDSIESIQSKIDDVMHRALEIWRAEHKIQEQRDRVSRLSTDKNVNIIVNNIERFS